VTTIPRSWKIVIQPPTRHLFNMELGVGLSTFVWASLALFCCNLLATAGAQTDDDLKAPPGDAATEEVRPVAAFIETTLPTAGRDIRQYAFDGNLQTCFVSEDKPTAEDHFTLVLEQPVELTGLTILTGRPDGSDGLNRIEVLLSSDGKEFRSIGHVTGNGEVPWSGQEAGVQAIRLQPPSDMEHPLALRQLQIESQPDVATFEFPVEFVIDVSDAPEMQEWAERVARICERAWPMINEELRSEGYRPRTVVPMRLSSDYRGVAAVSGGRITGSVRYFTNNPEDVGAMVHEAVHVVQNYRGRRNPGWLVEGIADYIRFFKYEPGRLGRINPQRARYDGSYRVSAAFLAYLVNEYDADLVRKLNELMRKGEYRDEVFEELTGKPLEELDIEWRRTLRR